MATIDHLVVAGSDLTALVAWWIDRSGETPTTGGAHEGRGTRNALAGLGGPTYLELIAPDPGQEEPAEPRPFGIDDLDPATITFVTYAVAVRDLDAALASADDDRLAYSPGFAMERTRPDGVTLRWRLALPTASPGGAVPFLIEWGDTPHPTLDLVTAVELTAVEASLPDPDPLASFVATLGLGDRLAVVEGSPGCAASLATPNGEVVL